MIIVMSSKSPLCTLFHAWYGPFRYQEYQLQDKLANAVFNFNFRYELMSSCWKENPLMRPAFSQIAQQLKNFLREVKVINGCIQKLSISSLPFAFLKIISALFFLLPFINYASLYPSMDPSVTLSVLLINLLSPTAAIHSSIRKHSHPNKLKQRLNRN